MFKLISALTATAAVLVPSAATKPMPKPMPAPNGTIIVRIAPDLVIGGDNYAVDPGYSITPSTTQQPTVAQTADARYQQMKNILDQRFANMFEIKAALEKTQAETQKQWDEYYALKNAYEKQLKKLIADWVTDQHYQVNEK